MRPLLNGGTLAGRRIGKFMLLAHHRELVADLREPTRADPWRVLVSGCLNGWRCGVDSTDYGLGASLSHLICLPTFRAFPFCPEQYALGTPRTTPDIHGGDGFDVIAGRARVLDERGDDVTDKMLSGARAMMELALDARAELAIVTDMGRASTSVLQRRLSIGYGRAAKILDSMERQGFIGPAEGSKPRKVLQAAHEFRERIAQRLEEDFD